MDWLWRQMDWLANFAPGPVVKVDRKGAIQNDEIDPT